MSDNAAAVLFTLIVFGIPGLVCVFIAWIGRDNW